MTQKSDTTNLIRTVFTTEVKMVVGIIMFALGVIAPYYAIKEDISLIKKDVEIINSNHLTHLQDVAEIAKDNQVAIIELQKQLILITSQLNK